MSNDCAPTLFDFLSGYEGIETVPHLIRLIARGKPVSTAELAADAGEPIGRVESWFRSQPGTDWDDEGRLVGFGLTLRPTTHKFVVDGTILYTFCALDTLIFPAVIGRAAVVESNCAATGRKIRIELTPSSVVSVDPPTTVTSLLVPADHVADIRGSVCAQGHFFASSEDAQNWIKQHPTGQVLSIEDAFQSSLAQCKELGWVIETGEESVR
jgi:alkylmercury lyase